MKQSLGRVSTQCQEEKRFEKKKKELISSSIVKFWRDTEHWIYSVIWVALH